MVRGLVVWYGRVLKVLAGINPSFAWIIEDLNVLNGSVVTAYYWAVRQYHVPIGRSLLLMILALGTAFLNLTDSFIFTRMQVLLILTAWGRICCTSLRWVGKAIVLETTCAPLLLRLFPHRSFVSDWKITGVVVQFRLALFSYCSYCNCEMTMCPKMNKESNIFY